jgi:glycosyltransferase involved in cell wall biosynthesis
VKVLCWGTGDKGKPRDRILLAALKSTGVEVTEIHQDVWAGIEDKSQLRSSAKLIRYVRWIGAYPILLLKFLVAPKPDAIVLTYPAQVDALVIWPAARMRNVPILMDLFISLYDTSVVDRQLAPPGSLKARLLWLLEWLAIRAADRTIVDTAAHARYIEELFRLPEGSIANVPVGAEVGDFPRLPQPSTGERPQILFYGQLIPLHGIETVLEAAMSAQGTAFDWTIVGLGQDAPKVAAMLGKIAPSHIRWLPWVPYAELNGWIAKSEICLGIFGGSRKAASVIPNKVYQALASGRHVVTRKSPAMDELAADPGITLVEPESADALLDGIERALRAGCPPPSHGLVESFSLAKIGSSLASTIDDLRSKED